MKGGFAHFVVRVWDAGDDYEIYGWVLQGFINAAVGFGAWVVFLGIVVGFGGALDDAVQFVDVGKGADERDVENFGAERRSVIELGRISHSCCAYVCAHLCISVEIPSRV